MPSYPLNTSARVVLNASGNGTASLGPPVGVTWRLSVASVKTSSAVLVPQCNIYIGGAPTDDFFVDGTFTGSLDSSDSVAEFPITPGQKLWAVWTGGDVGAVATVSVLGTADSGGSRNAV